MLLNNRVNKAMKGKQLESTAKHIVEALLEAF